MEKGHVLDKILYRVGSEDIVKSMPDTKVKEPFADDICEFLSHVSKMLMGDARTRQYPDVVTFGFWIRKAALKRLKEQFQKDDGNIRLGRGVAFHIAPSNVPVNFAYSLVAGLLSGNSNIVRIPSKDFPQVRLLIDAFRNALETHKEMEPYVAFVQYGRNRDVNDVLSSMADIRIVWGGDATIAELRKSPLPPRSTEITFADRYSLAVVDSDVYLAREDKGRVAEDFYNDTYLTDQNACTSPRIVIWVGNQKEDAKAAFWEELHKLVEKKYNFQDIQGVNKLASGYLAAAILNGCSGEIQILPHVDNLVIRVHVTALTAQLMDFKDSCGYFFEYDCDDVMELYDICNDKRCQTVGIIGDVEQFFPLVKMGIKGVDRIVPIGKTMDFDLSWDGYDLVRQMSRVVVRI